MRALCEYKTQLIKTRIKKDVFRKTFEQNYRVVPFLYFLDNLLVRYNNRTFSVFTRWNELSARLQGCRGRGPHSEVGEGERANYAPGIQAEDHILR